MLNKGRKLTNIEVKYIKDALFKKEATIQQIADVYNVANSTIGYIKKRKTYKNVN